MSIDSAREKIIIDFHLIRYTHITRAKIEAQEGFLEYIENQSYFHQNFKKSALFFYKKLITFWVINIHNIT